MSIILFILILLVFVRYIIMVPGYLLLYFFIRWKKLKEIEEKSFQSNLEENEKQDVISIESKPTFKEKIITYCEGFLWYSILYTGRIPSHLIRNFLYHNIYLVNFAKTAVIFNNVEIRDPFKLKIGKGSMIGNKSILDCRRGGIIIGNNVNFSTGVWLWTGQHDYQDPYFRSVEGRRGPIIIKDRVWLGPRVTVLHSITIGEGAVVAAGAVVTKDIEPYSLNAGIPAKKIGERNRDLRYEFDGTHLPFY